MKRFFSSEFLLGRAMCLGLWMSITLMTIGLYYQAYLVSGMAARLKEVDGILDNSKIVKDMQQRFAEKNEFGDEMSWEKVVESADRGLASGKHMDAFYMMRAFAKANMHLVAEAELDFYRAKEVDPRNYGKNTYSFEVANALAEQGEYDRAERMLENLIKDYPDLPANFAAYARLLATSHVAERRKPRRALELAKEAYRLYDDQDRYVRILLADAYAVNGKFEEAIQEANVALGMKSRVAGVQEIEDTAIERRIVAFKQRLLVLSHRY